MSFIRCKICFDCMNNDNYVKDIFKICGQAYHNLMNYNCGYDIIEFDVRDNFNFQCNAKINGTYSIINDEHFQDVCITVKRQNLLYNIYHVFGHFFQNKQLNEQKIQDIYQKYLQNSDIFNLPHDYSIIKDECIPQLISHYFLNQLNDSAKKFVQENILIGE